MRVLVVAKAPVPGRVKTRLAAAVGPDGAAEVAAAALLDTLQSAAAAVGSERCHLALDGGLGEAVRGAEIRALLDGWTVTPQRGDGFAARLAAAHDDAGAGPVVQVGMDTPQMTAQHLVQVFTDLVELDAVIAPAEDGGWWALGRRDPAPLRALTEVAMSEPTTYADTWAALEAQQQRVGASCTLRDVDTPGDADAVAAQAPHTRFAEVWRTLAGSTNGAVPS